MADFTALKTAIQTYIKQNGNEEITGEKLQEILLSVVTTLGDSAINDLVTALANEVAARQNADGTLQQNITNEATVRGNADTALSNRLGSTITAENTAAAQIAAEAEARGNADTALQGLINGIKQNIDNGYVYAGIATPSSTPATGKVFYLALTAGTYTNFGSSVVSQGINILKYNGSAWLLDAFIGIDDVPTPSSTGIPKSGGTFDFVMKNGSAFDISAHFASGGTLATYADLSAALAALDTLPAAYKRGGMVIRYVDSSDNKYKQFRLISDSFTTNVASWYDCDGAKKYRLYNAFDIIGDSALNVSPSQIGTMLAAFPQDERKGFAAVLYRNNVNVPKIILFQSQNAANWENATYWYDIAMTEEIKNSLVSPYSARDNVTSHGIYKSNAPAYESLLFVSENEGNIGQLEIGMFHENQVIIRTRKKTGENWGNWTDYITSITQLQQQIAKINMRKNVVVVRSAELIDIYTLIPNTEKYINFKLRYRNNVTDNVDYWRICDSYFGTLNGYNFTQEKQVFLFNENEYVILINGASDYTGGLHGDEKIINTPILSLDGHLYPVSSLEANFVKVCDNISFIEYSNMYDTLAGDDSVFAKHYKLTEISSGSISISNTLKFIKNVSIKQLFAGLFCVHKDISSMFVGQDATIHDTSGDDSTTYPNVEPVDSKVVFSNPNNRLSAKCASEFIYGYDNDKGQIEVWDRTDDTKYYRRTNVAESIESGKVIKAHSECTFMYFPN